MPRYSKASLDKLSGCHPDLVLIFNEAIKRTDIRILEGVRPADRQYELYKQGRSKCDGFKRKSNHQVKSDGYSWAVDAVPYPVDFADTARFKALAALVLEIAGKLYAEGKIKHHLEWGGNWKTFTDMPHYELKQEAKP